MNFNVLFETLDIKRYLLYLLSPKILKSDDMSILWKELCNVI